MKPSKTLLIASTLAIAACSTGARSPVATAGPAMPASSSYRLGANDRVRIMVYGEERYSGEFNIAGDGTIAVPLLGPYPAARLTLRELATNLTRTLGSGYLLNPHVTADIVTFRPVFVLGEVEKPGQYPYSENMTIYGLVAQAGGFTYRGNRGRARIRHENETEERKYKIGSASAVRPGDTIRILQRIF